MPTDPTDPKLPARVLTEQCSEAHLAGEPLHTLIARAIQRDGQALGVDFDDDFALMLADGVIAGLGYDDEAQIDALSLVFDDDVRRALAA